MAYFAASCDDVETNTKFAASLELDFPILSDPGKTTAEAYGVLIPVMRLPNRWTFYVGKDGTILSIDKNVKAGTAGKDLAANLEKLGVPKAGGAR